jgi:hypothetical protein
VQRALAPAVRARLEADAVEGDRIARRELFTWTTPDQVQELRSYGQLLTRSVADSGERSRFDARLAARGGAIESLLLSRPLALRRFAWPNPWGAMISPGDGPYGSELVRVVLRDGAIIGRLDSRAAVVWSFFDLDGNAVSEAEVLARPERLAAIHHAHHPEDSPGEDVVPYREYVLCNEAMIASWEVGTPAVAARLEASMQALTLLAEHFTAGLEPQALALVQAGLAFTGPAHDIGAQRLRGWAEWLASLPASPPLVHNVALAYGAPAPKIVAPPRPARRWRDSSFCP